MSILENGFGLFVRLRLRTDRGNMLGTHAPSLGGWYKVVASNPFLGILSAVPKQLRIASLGWDEVL